MDNRDKKVLGKILQHINSTIAYCNNCNSLQDFEADSMRVEACVFNLMQIGELSKVSLSDEAKTKISSIPWNQLYGMRNRIVHGYDGVEMTIVWDTIANDLPVLKMELEKYL